MAWSTTSSRQRIVRSLLLFLPSLALGAQPQLFEAVEPHMGTLVRIQLYTSSEAQAKAAFRAAFDRIAELDRLLSDYKPDSELNRLPPHVGPDLFRVLEASQRLAADSGGAFDVTVGAVTRLWRQARKEGRPPDPEALRNALNHTGYRKLHLDPAARGVTLDDPEIHLDLGGIAKGYAADEALAVLARAGIRSALVAVSGDLAFSGAPPGRRGWKIDAGGRVLELSNAAVSTSGAAEQHLGLYSHIVDPATGLGITDPITVTIVAPHGIDSDGLATAVSILGYGRGQALVQTRQGAYAYIQKGP
jgi:thiamine biosynthesis lipoprotein